MKGAWTAIATFAGVPLLVIALVIGLATDADACGTTTATTATTPSGSIAGYRGDQLDNAATIINTTAQRGMPTHAQLVAVATAMGESSLRNLGYGDWETSGVTNPDGTPTTSIGLFQQQDNWGTRKQRLDPATATGLFLDALEQLDGWETLPVTIAAHRVQRNANANHYAAYEQPARDVIAALTGTQLTACVGTYSPATGKPPGPWGGYENGRIPATALVAIPWDTRHTLRADAAAGLIALNSAFRAQFGYDLPVNDGYRSYQQQVTAKQTYGDGAATPGTSNHGWAMAVDISDRNHFVIGYHHPIYLWLTINAARYGWAHPAWAQPSGPGPHEAWHWEYYGSATG